MSGFLLHVWHFHDWSPFRHPLAVIAHNDFLPQCRDSALKWASRNSRTTSAIFTPSRAHCTLIWRCKAEGHDGESLHLLGAAFLALAVRDPRFCGHFRSGCAARSGFLPNVKRRLIVKQEISVAKGNRVGRLFADHAMPRGCRKRASPSKVMAEVPSRAGRRIRRVRAGYGRGPGLAGCLAGAGGAPRGRCRG